MQSHGHIQNGRNRPGFRIPHIAVNPSQGALQQHNARQHPQPGRQHLPLKSPQQPDQNHNPEGNQHNQCILAQLYCNSRCQGQRQNPCNRNFLQTGQKEPCRQQRKSRRAQVSVDKSRVGIHGKTGDCQHQVECFRPAVIPGNLPQNLAPGKNNHRQHAGIKILKRKIIAPAKNQEKPSQQRCQSQLLTVPGQIPPFPDTVKIPVI